MTNQPNRSVTGWDWSELEYWLPRSNLPEPRRASVRKIIDAMKAPAKELIAPICPLKAGSVWHYRSSLGNLVVVRLLGRQFTGERQYYCLETTDSGVTRKEYVAVEKDGVYRRVGEEDSRAAIKVLSLPPEAGDSWTYEYQVGGVPTEGRSVVSIQDVSVPAGKFTDAVVVEQRIRLGKSSTSDTTTTWYAGGIGMVKQVSIRGLKAVTLELERFEPGSAQPPR